MKATYIDHMGTDLSVVNAARVSFSKTSDWVYDTTPGSDLKGLSKADKGLIGFLARGCTTGDWDQIIEDVITTSVCDLVDPELDPRDELLPILRHIRKMPDHWTPFGHTSITFHMKAPIFIARQLGKHQVSMVWNEVSRRYVTDTPDFYTPQGWRLAAENVKQGSSDETTDWGHGSYKAAVNKCLDVYEDMLEMGICPEQARMVLPQSMYTEWYWTGNLYAFANVFIQRTDSHAQREVQEIAKQVGEIIEPLFPVSWPALIA